MEGGWSLIGEKGYYRINTKGRIQTRLVSGSKTRSLGNWKDLRVFFKYTSAKNKSIGYMSVRMSIDGLGPRNYYLHRILAEKFLENPKMLKEVNHIDGNRFNNDINNLEWCTRKENMKNAKDRGVLKGYTGKKGARINYGRERPINLNLNI